VYVFWSACVLPLCVGVCANVVVITRLLISHCQARCKQRVIDDKPEHLNASVHRVRKKIENLHYSNAVLKTKVLVSSCLKDKK